MSLAEQALFLLDIQPSIRGRNNPENFSSLDQTIVASLPEAPIPASPALGALAGTTANKERVVEANPFSVASRMSRSNYEDQARAEALTQALRQIRASNAAQPNSARRFRQS